MGPGVWQGAESTYDGQETQRTWMTPTPQYSPVNNITSEFAIIVHMYVRTVHVHALTMSISVISIIFAIVWTDPWCHRQ